jgi:GNAT superfamily N-acetyltransferase
MSTDPELRLERLDPRAAREEELAALINVVYAEAERGLWQEGFQRTSAGEVAALIRAGEIVVATRRGRIAGSVRIRDVDAGTSEFGLLVADPGERNRGVGRALLDHVEAHSRERGRRALQLELLVPRDRPHPSKEFLKAWYGRRGYRISRVDRFDDAYPQVAPLLATPCDLQTRTKAL